jgi:phospholipase A1
MKKCHSWIMLLILINSLTVQAEDSLLQARIKSEHSTAELPFVLTPHRVNYIIATYNSTPNIVPFIKEAELFKEKAGLDNTELKFQVSIKFPLMYNIFGDNGHLFVAYTNQSYWQINNKENSSPFREINHEPEVFIMFNNDWKIAGLTNSLWAVGADHQSNGQSLERSRSWNRLYGTMIFDRGSFALKGKLWWRIPEGEKELEKDYQGDDNPDIEAYMGNFEMSAAYGIDEHRYSAMVRHNLNKSNRGALEITWSYPINGNLRLYTQYFNGYGESLIDYNVKNQRMGIGISINDIL